LRGTDGRPDSGYTIDQHPGGLAVAAEVRSPRRGPPWVSIVQPATPPLAPMPTAWHRAAAGIVCKRLDTAQAKDAAAEALDSGLLAPHETSALPTCVCSGYSSLALRSFAGET
jgi:hypothetical protein